VKLRYTLRAAAELDEVLTYIPERSPQGACRVQTRIQEIVNLCCSTRMWVPLQANVVCVAWLPIPIRT